MAKAGRDMFHATVAKETDAPHIKTLNYAPGALKQARQIIKK
jgi:hypothetical protein